MPAVKNLFKTCLKHVNTADLENGLSGKKNSSPLIPHSYRIICPKNIAFKKILLVPYHAALKLVLS